MTHAVEFNCREGDKIEEKENDMKLFFSYSQRWRLWKIRCALVPVDHIAVTNAAWTVIWSADQMDEPTSTAAFSKSRVASK